MISLHDLYVVCVSNEMDTESVFMTKSEAEAAAEERRILLQSYSTLRSARVSIMTLYDAISLAKDHAYNAGETSSKYDDSWQEKCNED